MNLISEVVAIKIKYAIRTIIVIIGVPMAFILMSFAAVFVYVLFNGFDYEVPLPHDYKLVRPYSGLILLYGPEVGAETKSRSNVMGYRIINDIVIGCVGKEGQCMSDVRAMDRKYFILDTGTGKIRENLNWETWAYELGKIGIKPDIRLQIPIRPIPIYMKPFAAVYECVIDLLWGLIENSGNRQNTQPQ